MKSIYFISVFLFFSITVFGQPDVAYVRLASQQISSITEVSGLEESAWVAPSFPGGQDRLMQLISDGLTYPDLARENSIEGTVILRLTITSNGAVSNVNVLQSLGFGCDEAVVDQVNKLPRFKPGLIYGQGTESTFDIPIRFRLR